MKYITITASSFEEAVRKAREEYGDDVRVLSRRDYTVGGGLFSKKRGRCDITIYLSSGNRDEGGRTDEVTMKEFEKEAQTPDPGTLTSSERLDTEIFRGAFDGTEEKGVRSLLEENRISGPLLSSVLERLEGKKADNTAVSSAIMELCPISRNIQIHPDRYIVLLGPTGGGKTTTSAKLAVLYGGQGLSVSLISLDSFKVGAFGQFEELCKAFGIPSFSVSDEGGMLLALEEASGSSLVIIDTMGISPKDVPLNIKLKGLIDLIGGKDVCFLLVLPATLSCSEMKSVLARYSGYNISAVVATKLDESSGIGDILSFCYGNGIPLAFCTNGQHVPGDIEKASTVSVLANMDFPGMDMKEACSQIKSDLP